MEERQKNASEEEDDATSSTLAVIERWRKRAA